MRRAVASFSLHLIQDVILEDSVQSGEEKQGIKEKYRKREISCMGGILAKKRRGSDLSLRQANCLSFQLKAQEHLSTLGTEKLAQRFV